MKKINIGILLIILSIIMIIIYSIYLEVQKDKEKENINIELEKYFEVYNKYSLLEEKYRDINKSIDEKSYEEYLREIKDNLKDFVLEDRQEYMYNQYKKRLDEQVMSKYMLNKYVKKIDKINNYTFYKDYIIVNVGIKVTVDKDKRIAPVFDNKTNKYIGEIKKQQGEDYIDEAVAFKKENGKYKIVLHNIVDPEVFTFEQEEYIPSLVY